MGLATALAVEGEETAGRVYNVADPVAYTEAEWVRRIARVTGWGGEVVVVSPPGLSAAEPDDSDYRHPMVLDTSRIRHELGYVEQLPEEEALRRTLDWERANPPDWKAAEFDYAAEDRMLERRRGR